MRDQRTDWVIGDRVVIGAAISWPVALLSLPIAAIWAPDGSLMSAFDAVLILFVLARLVKVAALGERLYQRWSPKIAQ